MQGCISCLTACCFHCLSMKPPILTWKKKAEIGTVALRRMKLLWFMNQTQAACCCLAVCHLPLEIILLCKIKFIGLNPKHSTLLRINFEICLYLHTRTIRCTALVSFPVWRGDWTNLPSITFKADHSRFLLLVKPGSSSSKLAIAVRGDSHENKIAATDASALISLASAKLSVVSCMSSLSSLTAARLSRFLVSSKLKESWWTVLTQRPTKNALDRSSARLLWKIS